MANVTSALVRYTNDLEFQGKVHEVVRLLEEDKPTPLTVDEVALITISAALALEVNDVKRRKNHA